MSVNLIAPYGGRLVDLLPADGEAAGLLAERANHLPSLQLSPRALCDLEMLMTGGFSPLDRFMGAADYQSVLDSMRLADGTLFPIPIVLPVIPVDADPRSWIPGPEIPEITLLEIAEFVAGPTVPRM